MVPIENVHIRALFCRRVLIRQRVWRRKSIVCIVFDLLIDIRNGRRLIRPFAAHMSGLCLISGGCLVFLTLAIALWIFRNIQKLLASMYSV